MSSATGQMTRKHVEEIRVEFVKGKEGCDCGMEGRMAGGQLNTLIILIWETKHKINVWCDIYPRNGMGWMQPDIIGWLDDVSKRN